ncbi:MAG: VWA domain-containing protein [Phycisphaerae bacterium]|nr:VWA domain-containing protein [Phycisphaerae bacterium]
MQKKRITPWRTRRRAVAIAQVAVMSTVIMGMGAMVVDLGSMYMVQAELQSIADAAALAAAAQLAGSEGGNTIELARAAAIDCANRNMANGTPGGIEGDGDIEFGKATFNPATGQFQYASSDGPTYDAVRITARRAGETSLSLTFANFLGVGSANLAAQATATLVPRDLVVVIDISNSMCYDSELRYYLSNYYDGSCSNLHDVWCAIDGPEPEIPYEPGCPYSVQYNADTGPAYGLMDEWGSDLDSSYNAATDPGLFYIPRYSATTNAEIVASLVSRGYNSTERSALLNGPSDGDSTSYKNRVQVLLGLADWTSGISGGKFPVEAGGNGNTYIGSTELTGVVDVGEELGSLAWSSYIDNMMNGRASSSMFSGFKYYYGPKTLVDYLMQYRPSNAATPILWQTPEQPLRAVKDAVQVMANHIESLQCPDQMALVVYASSSPPPEVYLTDNLQATPSRLYQMQTSHYGNSSTNIGGGLSQAIQELKYSPATRATAKKVIVLMSDGCANVGGDSLGPEAYALAQAEYAADESMMIYTVSVGSGVDRGLMQEIAEIGNGVEFYASGNPEEYTEELEEIFRSLGGRRPVVLIE